MNFKTLVRSIFIGFLIAVPAPFLIEWLTANSSINDQIIIFCSVYLLGIIGCLVMGMCADNGKVPAKRSVSRLPDNRELGTVKWFNRSKGFGFITRGSGEDVFVHYRSIAGNGRRSLSEGQKVRLSVVRGDKGLQAEDVTVEQ